TRDAPGGARVRALLVAAGFVVLALGAGGCTEDPPVRGERAKGPRGPAPVTLTALPAEPGDYWLARFGPYMSAEERRAYEATPEPDRYERFGGKLLEYQRREELLEPYRGRLDAAKIEEYRRLPDFESCRRFLEAKFKDGG